MMSAYKRSNNLLWRKYCLRQISVSRTFFTSETSVSRYQNDCQLLGIKSNASKSEIKEAYFLKAKEFHPDTNSGDDTATFLKINEAYKRLMHEKSNEGKPINQHQKYSQSDPRMRDFYQHGNPFGDPGSREYWEMRNRRNDAREQFEEEMKWKQRAREANLIASLRTIFVAYFVTMAVVMIMSRANVASPDGGYLAGCRCEKCILQERRNNPGTTQIVKKAAM